MRVSPVRQAVQVLLVPQVQSDKQDLLEQRERLVRQVQSDKQDRPEQRE